MAALLLLGNKRFREQHGSCAYTTENFPEMIDLALHPRPVSHKPSQPTQLTVPPEWPRTFQQIDKQGNVIGEKSVDCMLDQQALFNKASQRGERWVLRPNV
jgi:hypothetical protein